MINTEKYRDISTELNTPAKISIKDLSNSKLSEVSLEESNKICGGMFTLKDLQVTKRPRPVMLPQGLVYQPNERLRRCAIGSVYC